MSIFFNLTVASFDESVATVCSPDNQIFQIPLSLLPGDLMPGNILRVQIEVNNDEELRRRQAIYKLLDDVAVYIKQRDANHEKIEVASIEDMSSRQSRKSSINSLA
jgi:hypothetical protein